MHGSAPLNQGGDGQSRTAAADRHGREVSSMFGRIARWYDLLNHMLSLGQDIYWRHQLVRMARLPRDSKGLVLDLAAGTLDVSLEFLRRHPGLRVLAMDFSEPMLRRGATKIPTADRQRIALALADGRSLPLPDACVDCVSIAFGIRNILPRQQALAEAFRVLRPGGRFCILEFGTGDKRIWKGVYNFYLSTLLPRIGNLVSGDASAYTYLAQTIKAFPPAEELGLELQRAGFGRVYYRPMLSGIVYLHAAEK